MASDLGGADAATVDVLHDVVYMGCELMGADGPPMPLEEYVGRGAAATAADDRAETEFHSPTPVSSAKTSRGPTCFQMRPRPTCS